jgi:hypothetical protein
MWSQFVEKKEQWIGGTLEDFGDAMDQALSDSLTTEIKDIVLRANGSDSAFFEVIGEDFTCGSDVKYFGVTAGEEGWITFSGYGGHKWRIKERES